MAFGGVLIGRLMAKEAEKATIMAPATGENDAIAVAIGIMILEAEVLLMKLDMAAVMMDIMIRISQKGRLA